MDTERTAKAILEIARALRRAAGVKAGPDTPAFGSGGHCLICGEAGRWDARRGVTLCSRHLEALLRGEL